MDEWAASNLEHLKQLLKQNILVSMYIFKYIKWDEMCHYMPYLMDKVVDTIRRSRVKNGLNFMVNHKRLQARTYVKIYDPPV